MKKLSIIIFGLALILLIGWKVYQEVYISKKGSDNERKKQAVAVEVSPVKKDTIRDVQIFTGTLKPRAHFVVAPKIAGRLEKLMVNIGDVIKHDQLIAVLEDEEYVQQVEQSRAELAVAKANLEEQNSTLKNAQREFERSQALREKKIASESELDSAKAQLEAKSANYKVAMAQVSQKEAALKAAQVRLSYTKIHASLTEGNGSMVVGERFVDEGALLQANSPIVSVFDISFMTAVIFVIERDYPKVKIGQEALITTDAYPDRPFTGRIIRVAPVLKEESRQARVEIEIPNPDRLLKPGMFTRVQIEFAKHEGVTVVPLPSLARRADQQGVFLVDTEQMKARFVPLKLGIVNGDLAEVVNPPLSGLVVILGQHLLEDGSDVILPDEHQESQGSK
jgi:RND family efflux transporter MFP subunit